MFKFYFGSQIASEICFDRKIHVTIHLVSTNSLCLWSISITFVIVIFTTTGSTRTVVTRTVVTRTVVTRTVVTRTVAARTAATGAAGWTGIVAGT